MEYITIWICSQCGASNKKKDYYLTNCWFCKTKPKFIPKEDRKN